MSYGYQGGELGLFSGQKFLALRTLVAKDEAPTYVYDLDDIVNRTERLKAAFNQQVTVHYAMKANHNLAVLKTLAQVGIGVDVVSGGEIDLALRVGFPPSRIVFSGVGKTRGEIQLALQHKICQINVESPGELRRIGEVARAQKTVAPVALRFNPDVNPETHPYIRTGFRENKFGMDASFFPEVQAVLGQFKDCLKLVGITLHIGSQLRDVSPLLEAVRKSIPWFQRWQEAGHQLSTFDVGGGLGIDYHSGNSEGELRAVEAYARGLLELLKPVGGRILCEPGRILVARAGVLLCQVQYLKETPYKRFAIVNTGMHHLLRPALYEAYHRILPLRESSGAEVKTYDVVGPICESADVLGHDRPFAGLQEGDWLAVMDSGAYGAVMSSHYNLQAPPREVAIRSGEVIS